MNDDQYELTPEEAAAYAAKLDDESQAMVDADIEAELEFQKAFRQTRGSDREVRAEAFGAQMAKQVARSDAGGQGRTQFAPPVKDIPSEYEVKSGDTMWALAKRYGISVQDLQALNADIDPTRMQLGSKLKLKPTEAAPAQPAQLAAPAGAARTSKTLDTFDQAMAKLNTPARINEAMGAAIPAARGAAAVKGVSSYLRNILSNMGARPAQAARDRDARTWAMDEMARRGPPANASLGRPYPNEIPPWRVK